MSEEFWLQLTHWLSSDDYKGSVLVPENYVLDDAYRLRIIEMTEPIRKSKKGILLFGLPGLDLPAPTVSLSQFMN